MEVMGFKGKEDDESELLAVGLKGGFFLLMPKIRIPTLLHCTIHTHKRNLTEEGK